MFLTGPPHLETGHLKASEKQVPLGTGSVVVRCSACSTRISPPAWKCVTIARPGAVQLRGAHPTRFPISRVFALALLVCAVGASGSGSAASPALRPPTPPAAPAPALREAGVVDKMSDTEAETEVVVLPPTAGIPTAEFIDNVDVFLEKSRQVLHTPFAFLLHLLTWPPTPTLSTHLSTPHLPRSP